MPIKELNAFDVGSEMKTEMVDGKISIEKSSFSYMA